MKKNELLTKKIEENFQEKEDFFKLFNLKEETYKKRMKNSMWNIDFTEIYYLK